MRNMGMCVLLLFSAIALSACSVSKFKTSPLAASQGVSGNFYKGVKGTKETIETYQDAKKVVKTADTVSDTVNTVNKIQDNPSSKKSQ